ncbi:[FeFe] hydrogenase H-cluster radical SAM maturase HydE [Pectinatus brassicae]|uniref:Biotin synthase n=1 Tax=Pectinatus brassicae TaxID=862415 RepID=A0A840UMU6_9FIRM|nr:[FeFe] hydrogenase H-cluster radical SAM maturase HydE [Pectinatus brassicae]MBB5337530.1 biotin synthase [Pectinatus brassicae]
MNDLIKKAQQLHSLTLEEIIYLLQQKNNEEELAQAADIIRQKYVGDGIHLRGLIEFSNICRQNCLYCGLRRDNKKIERYRLNDQMIVEMAKKAKNYGYKTVVLQSGEDVFFTAGMLADIVKKIKEMDLAVTLSIGERSFEEYEILKKAGADRFLLRIETTDEKLYDKMDPGMSFINRRRCLADLKKLNYEVGTGCLVGLPGQSMESLANDILFFQQIDADMIGIGPLIPNEDTPLAKVKSGDFSLTRKMVALIRLLLPEANIPATTAMETLQPNARTIILCSGANVVMPNVTEGDYRRKYALYPGKICVADTPEQCRSCMGNKISSIGRYISTDKGFRQRNI